MARDDFLANYSRHLSKVGRSENASEYYEPCRDNLGHQLDEYDLDYENIKDGHELDAGHAHADGSKPCG